MLESIHIESYRTLRNTTVTFKDGLNIIIGKNGVGKSNLLGFISTYTAYNVLRFFPNINFKFLNSTFKIDLSYANYNGERVTIKVVFDRKTLVSPDDVGHSFDVIITKSLNSQIVRNNIALSQIDNTIRAELQNDIRFARPFGGTYIAFNLPQEIPYLSTSAGLSMDDLTGLNSFFENNFHLLNAFEFQLKEFIDTHAEDENIDDATFLKTEIVKGFEKAIQNSNLNETLASFTNIERIRLSSNVNIYKTESGTIIENLVLEFMVDGSWMPWSYLSDGTKRSFYLISQVAFAQNELILIEEPELGLHPFQLQKVMTFLKEQSATKQIILSTHSPEVLNVLEPDELDRILIATIDKGVTSFNNLTEAQKEKAKSYMAEVGDLSYYWLHSDLERND